MSGEELTPEVLARREYHVRNALAIAQIQGFLSRNLPYSDSLNDDELFLCGLREHIYSTHHNQLDYESLLVDIMKIKEKYEKPL